MSVHGSRRASRLAQRATGSPRTDMGALKLNKLAVRPEPVEGRMANDGTVSTGGGPCNRILLSSGKMGYNESHERIFQPTPSNKPL